jgi:hypothetical protein
MVVSSVQDASKILAESTPRSLVILDEVLLVLYSHWSMLLIVSFAAGARVSCPFKGEL